MNKLDKMTKDQIISYLYSLAKTQGVNMQRFRIDRIATKPHLLKIYRSNMMEVRYNQGD